jgi:hypothetical protein
MKCRELSNVLNKANEILTLYPLDTEISTVLEDLKRLKEKEITVSKPGKEEVMKTDEHSIKEKIDKVVGEIENLSITDVGNVLTSTELFPSMDLIRYFAKKIGVDIGSRQSRTNSIHTIQRHLDRMRIDRTIAKRAD